MHDCIPSWATMLVSKLANSNNESTYIHIFTYLLLERQLAVRIDTSLISIIPSTCTQTIPIPTLTLPLQLTRTLKHKPHTNTNLTLTPDPTNTKYPHITFHPLRVSLKADRMTAQWHTVWNTLEHDNYDRWAHYLDRTGGVIMQYAVSYVWICVMHVRKKQIKI